MQIYLAVAAKNEGAKALYKSLGFTSYAYEKRALQVDGEFIDEEHMVLSIKAFDHIKGFLYRKNLAETYRDGSTFPINML